MQILRENQEWKSALTCLLEQIILHAYGGQCPIKFIKSLVHSDLEKREEAINELFELIFSSKSDRDEKRGQTIFKAGK